ncbi:hypothetical protein [Kineococcus terrestris]|uniref:hypothetical protein n=1 Tax=Kineococcus terrestris TaxID=2044856 RepID=UPI0034DB6E49
MDLPALDAPLLRALERARHLPLPARAWVPLLSLAVVAAVVLSAPQPPCTAADPCAPAPLLDLAGGALLASAALTALSGRVALGVGVVAALAQPALGGTWADVATPWGAATALAVAAHLAVQLAVVRRRERVDADVAAVLARTGAPLSAPPAPVGVPCGPLARAGLLAPAAAAAALALLVVGAVLQARGTAEEAASPVVTGVVVAHPGAGEVGDDAGFVVAVALPDGREPAVEVLDAAEHPVGAREPVRLLPGGGVRLVAEPYDAWGAPLLAGAGAALALAAAARRRRGTRAPASGPDGAGPHLLRAQGRVLPGVVLVHAADAGGEDAPVLAVPLDVAAGARLLGVPEPEDGDELDLPPVRPLELAGAPVPGARVAVRCAGVWLPVAGPAGDAADGPPLDLDPDDDGLDEDGLPAMAVPVADLADADRDGGGGEHRVPRRLAVLVVAPALVVTALGAQWATDLLGALAGRPVPAAVAAALLGLLALEAAWRFQLRPRLSWDADGFTSTGVLGRSRRYGWAHLLDVEADRRTGVVLTVRTGEAGRLDALGEVEREVEREGQREGEDALDALDALVGPVRLEQHAAGEAWLPERWRGWRTPAALRAALLRARAAGTRTVRVVERVPAPARPAELWALWLLVVVLAGWRGGW